MVFVGTSTRCFGRAGWRLIADLWPHPQGCKEVLDPLSVALSNLTNKLRHDSREWAEMVVNTMECYFCPSGIELSIQSDVMKFTCPRCGVYVATRRGEHKLKKSFRSNEPIISGWIREQNFLGIIPSFNRENIDNLRRLRKPTFRERSEKFLLAAVEKSNNLQDTFNVKSPDLIAASYSNDVGENSIIAKYLLEEGWLENPKVGGGHNVSPRGYIVADELRSRRAKSSQGFVAMWFGDEVSGIYDEAIDPAIRRAGYGPLRIDKKEDIVKIDDEILAEIRRSAFIVADFTEHRGGVYFEAGFAMGLDIPIVWTCREDHMDDLHFDIRQYNCLPWKDATDFAPKLQKRIEGFLGRGPLIDHQ